MCFLRHGCCSQREQAATFDSVDVPGRIVILSSLMILLLMSEVFILLSDRVLILFGGKFVMFGLILVLIETKWARK